MKLTENKLKNFNSPYYIDVFSDKKKKIDRIEPTTKDVFVKQKPCDFKNKSVVGSVRYVESSHTSGKKSYSWYNEDDLNLISDHIVNKGVMLTNNDVVVNCFSNLAAFMIDVACKNIGATMISTSSRNGGSSRFKIVDFLCELNVSVLACGPREAELLCEAFRVQGLIPAKNFPSLRAILVAGEVLTPARKKYLENAWGVSIFNIYGATELGNVAYSCDYGHLHFDETHYATEFLQEDGSFAPMPYNEAKAVYITTLSNQTAPLFRFETADIMKFLSGKCDCGSEDKLMIAYGRQRDFCFIGGREYSLYEIQEIVYSLSIIPFGWKLIIAEIPILQLEFNKRDNVVVDTIKKDAYKFFSCDSTELDIDIFDEFGLFDRTDIFKYALIKKPQYIFNTVSNDFDQIIEDGINFLTAKDFKSAEKMFKKGIEMSKYSPLGNYMMGILFMQAPENINGDKHKAYNYLSLSKYLGYRSEELDSHITSLSNILFNKF